MSGSEAFESDKVFIASIVSCLCSETYANCIRLSLSLISSEHYLLVISLV